MFAMLLFLLFQLMLLKYLLLIGVGSIHVLGRIDFSWQGILRKKKVKDFKIENGTEAQLLKRNFDN